MKKAVLTLAAIALGFTMNAQEVVKLSEVYQDPSQNLITQFVVDYEGASASEIKSSVEQWAASAFVDVRAVEMANGENYIVYKPLLTYTYSAQMMIPVEGKITAETKLEFKDGKMRVTITEVDSRYITDYGPVYSTTKDQFKTLKGNVDEIVNKGMYKQTYRRINAAILTNAEWAARINSIEVTSYTSTNDNW